MLEPQPRASAGPPSLYPAPRAPGAGPLPAWLHPGPELRFSNIPAPPGGTLIPLRDQPPDLPRPGPPRLAGTSCCPQSLSQTVGTSDRRRVPGLKR